MNKYIFTGKLYGRPVVLHRISKPKARALWGVETLAFCPCKMMPTEHTTSLIEPEVLKKHIEEGASPDTITFDRITSLFEWYNCNNETGKTISFYKVTYTEI